MKIVCGGEPMFLHPSKYSVYVTILSDTTLRVANMSLAFSTTDKDVNVRTENWAEHKLDKMLCG